MVLKSWQLCSYANTLQTYLVMWVQICAHFMHSGEIVESVAHAGKCGGNTQATCSRVQTSRLEALAWPSANWTLFQRVCTI